MNCVRCHGLMVRDYAFDLLDSDIQSQVWRCLCCGNLADSVILRNRLSQQAHVAGGSAATLPLAQTKILSLVA